MTVKDSNPQLMTAQEVADLLRVKLGTVYDSALKGRLPSVRLWSGSRRAVVRFERAAIERLIKERTIPARRRG